MSLIRLKSGKFLIIDAVPMSDELKQELNHITQDGALVRPIRHLSLLI